MPGNPSDLHRLGKPEVQGGTARNPFPVYRGPDRFSELTEFTVVVMNDEFWISSEKSVPKLLLRPVEGRKLRVIDMYDIPAFALHDSEDGKHGEVDRLPATEVARPYIAENVIKIILQRHLISHQGTKTRRLF